MKNFLLICLVILIGCSSSANEKLFEFSTSMDFEEFQVVLEHLKDTNKVLSVELSRHLGQFENHSVTGEVREIKFKSTVGYMVLEREDEYAFVIALFTSEESLQKIEKAYELAIEELGI